MLLDEVRELVEKSSSEGSLVFQAPNRLVCLGVLNEFDYDRTKKLAHFLGNIDRDVDVRLSSASYCSDDLSRR